VVAVPRVAQRVGEDGPVPSPILATGAVERLHTALQDFTVDGLASLLGSARHSALSRGDLAGVSYAVPKGERPSTLVRLFLLGEAVSAADAARALAPLSVADATELLEADGDSVRARVEVRPYGEAGSPDPWWVVSDFGGDVRPGPAPR
jgi:hypothetical protein